MGYRNDPNPGVRWLLDDLCVRLGFCLPPDEIRRLEECPPGDVDEFTDAVFAAQGLGDTGYRDLRQKVRELVARHMSVWAAAEED